MKLELKSNNNNPVALVTGSAKRLGAIIAQHLHTHGYRIIIHYRHSQKEAEALCEKFNTKRRNSCAIYQLDLNEIEQIPELIAATKKHFGRLDLLVNSASDFFPTPMEQATYADWQMLMNSNLTAPFFLSQAAMPLLAESQGSIINITDIYGERPLKTHPIYSTAKAGLSMLTKALARELGRTICVNAIAPGNTIWSKAEMEDKKLQIKTTAQTILKRQVDPHEIANAVLFLAQQKSMTGEIIHVDSGKNILV